jgi:aryl-alcohol dehydrogenase-like predicted oxidoreductase
MSIPLRPFGRTGVKVGALALGTMMFGRRGNPDHDDAIRVIHRALDAGVNLVDTGRPRRDRQDRAAGRDGVRA